MLFAVIANAQMDSTFYYYQGGRIHLHYNKAVIHLTLKPDSAINDNDLRTDNLHYYRKHQPSGSDVLLENDEPFSPIPESVLNKYMSNPRFANVGYTLERNGHLFYTKNLFVVRLKENITWDEFERLLNDNACFITEVCPWLERQYVISVGNQDDDLVNISNLFFESGLFEYSAPNFVWVNSFSSNDTYYSQQWALKNTGQDGGTLGIDINVEKAWTITQGSANIKVAVIDDGVDLTHPDLVSNLLSGYDPTGNNSAGAHVWNFEKHGTACAGVIAAMANNNLGVAGVAPNSKIIPIHSGNEEGSNDLIAAANGISWACQHGADVINASWGGGTPLDILDLAINSANSHGRNGKGCVIVAASGNYNSSSVDYPSNLYNVLSVGAVDRCGARSGREDAILETQPCNPWDDDSPPGSSYGEELSVVAPGTNVYATDRQGMKGFNHSIGANGNYYASFGGTSAACPHVSGVAALMLSVNPYLTSHEVRDIIELTAQKTRRDVYHYTDTIGHPNGEWNKYMGYGLVDAHRAVLKAAFNTIYGISTMTFCDVQTFTVQNAYNGNISDVSYTWTCSENLHIISGSNTSSVSVKGSGVGTGWLRCTVYHLGDTISSVRQVSVVYNSSETLYDNISITTNTTWSNTCTINGVTTVEPLSTLTITGLVHSTSSARFIVRPGGKLIIDGGTLTSACAGEMWQGIEVVGDRTKQQLPQYQGKVELLNGAVVENAWCGIRTGLSTDNGYLTTGGIITAESATFRNNRRALEINSYAHYSPSGNVSNYVSDITRCTFTVDNSNLFAANSTSFAEHVRLWDVKGVKFSGCDFSNTTTNPYGNGRGIYAEDAGFTVTKKCLVDYVDPSTCSCPDNGTVFGAFSGFTTAVEVNTTGNPYAVSVDWADFENNVTGVKVKGNLFTTVTRNTFNLDEWPDAHVAGNIGLKLDSCSGYKVEENQFERTTYPSGPNLIENSIGIAVANSGISDNSLYRNHFINLTRGISVTGNNGHHRFGTGLQMTCNYFNGNKYDVYLASGATVCYHQGTSTKGADNEFHNTSNTLNNFYNPGLFNVNYYFYNGDANLHPALYTGLNLTTISNVNNCASTLCGITPLDPTPFLLAGFQSDMNAYTTAMAGNNDADGRDIAGGTGVETQNFASLQQGGTGNLSETAQSLSDSYYTAVRTLMSDSLLALGTLEQWHTAAQPIADPYSLTETRFCEGYAELFAADVDDAEMANYAEFHAMKLALRVQNDNLDNQDNSGTPFVNWYALTPAQIAQLQTIAERNTGRASVMAKGVLCFFHGICYEDDSLVDDNDDTTGTRAKRVATDITDDAALTVYPNPTDDLLFVELRGAEIARVALYDLQGRMVTGTGPHAGAPQQGTTATMNLRNVPAGVYLLRVTDADGKEYHQKIVKR